MKEMMKQRIIISGLVFIGFWIYVLNFISCQKLDFNSITKSNIENLTSVNGSTIKVDLKVLELSPSKHPDYGVCYSSENTSPTIADSKVSFGSISEEDVYSKQIENLLPGVKYYFRAYIMNDEKVIYSLNIKELETLKLPTAIVEASREITGTSALFNGKVNAQNSITTVSFEYGTTASYGLVATASPSPLDGDSETKVTATITGLSINTDYHYRIKAVSVAGTVYSSDLTFTTLNIPAPTISALTASNITITSAIVSGNINAKGQSTTVTFEYGTTVSYGNTVTPLQSQFSDNSETYVSVGLPGLTANTLYHCRFKAVSLGGIVYGNDFTFTTLSIQPPTAVTNNATNITINSVTLNASVNANDLSTSVSFEYGTTVAYGNTVTATQSPVSGTSTTNVSANINGIVSGTLYHYRIKAVSTGGTTYGSDLTFTTTASSSGTVTDIDGNVYNTVTIGAQVWMVENLKVTKYNDGTAIPNVTDNAAWAGLTSPAYSWYNNNEPAYKATYGALYNWYALNPASNGNKNICPTGWHVPTDSDWKALFDYLEKNGYGYQGSGFDYAKSLAATSGWFKDDFPGVVGCDQASNNSSGFNGLGGGFRFHNSGEFTNMGFTGHWWSITEAWVLTINYGNGYTDYRSYSDYKGVGHSVRCIKD